MGRMLGAFDPNDQLDRPDLNKCPDCGCYFAGENCPLCGKPCPEEMRAGNRKEKKQKPRRASLGRVTFVDWYHSWWFIILMLFVFPVIGIVLLITSPHKRSHKITLVVIGLLYLLLSSYGISHIVSGIKGLWDHPVNTRLDKGDYIAACETLSPEDYYRSAAGKDGSFVSVTVKVKEKITDSDGAYNHEKYTTYYVCEDLGGRGVKLLVRDCNREASQNFLPGDVITVFGEGVGEITVYDMNYEPHTAPCIHMAYVVKGS